MKLTFFGGSKVVTGANYLLETKNKKILIDCGLFQGSRFVEEMNYEPFPYDPNMIDAVFVTHSHTDHIGRLPKLYREGFRGVVYASEPTKAIMEIALPDAFEKMVQESHQLGHDPLYSNSDITGLLGCVRGIDYRSEVLLEDMAITLRDTSHILGSSAVCVSVRESGKEKLIVFSGDLGNPPSILLNPIDYVERADYLVIESAYGDRLHEDVANRSLKLRAVIKETVDRKGVLMIPSFAVERTQELLLEIDRLMEQGAIPLVPIFVGSPLAQKITEAYNRFPEYFNQGARDLLKNNNGLFRFPWLTFTKSVQESKGINEVAAPKVIIAGSGMSQGGRILHHELRYLSDPNSTILFIGYQVAGSLGRRIFDSRKETETIVKVLGQEVPVRCRIEAIGGFSAHADQDGLVEFVRHAASAGDLKKVFVVQGEGDAAEILAQKIKEVVGVESLVPDRGDSFEFDLEEPTNETGPIA